MILIKNVVWNYTIRFYKLAVYYLKGQHKGKWLHYYYPRKRFSSTWERKVHHALIVINCKRAILKAISDPGFVRTFKIAFESQDYNICNLWLREKR